MCQHRKLALTTLSAAAAALLFAGCSGSNDTATAPPSPTFATDASVMPGMFGMSAMPGMPAMTAPMLAMGTPAVAPRGPDAVDINNFAFTSVTLTVPVGVTVTSTNHDEEPHTVVANDRSFHSPGMDTNGTYSFTFTNAGSFNYVLDPPAHARHRRR